MAASAQISARNPAPGSRLRRVFPILAWLAVVAAPFWHLHVFNRVMTEYHSDLAYEWAGVRDAFRGIDPYSAQGTADAQTAYFGHPLDPHQVNYEGFFYPAPLVVLLAPLRSLSLPASQRIFLLSLIPLLLLGFWLSIRFSNLQLTSSQAAAAVLLGFVSWPVIWGLRLQQTTLMVAALIFIAVFLLSRERDVLAGILMACTTMKPQMVLLLLLWLLLWAGLRRRWSFIASFAVSMAVLLTLAERILPNWIPHWYAEVRRYATNHGGFPLEGIFGHWLGVGATGLLLFWTIYILWQLRHCPTRSPAFGLAVTLALSATISATLGTNALVYNQCAIFPGCVILFFARPADAVSRLARYLGLALLVWCYAALFIAVLGETLLGASRSWCALPFANADAPVAVAIALGFLALQEVRKGSAEAEDARYRGPAVVEPLRPFSAHRVGPGADAHFPVS